MKPLRIFISSVQKEMAVERAALRDFLRGDRLLRKLVEPVLFEDFPAAGIRPDFLYLDEAASCDLYLGLFGKDYGSEDDTGVSPTEREYDEAGHHNKPRFVFIKGGVDEKRHPKMEELIIKAGRQITRRRFHNQAELIGGVYAALVDHLEKAQIIRSGPFDAAVCAKAQLEDLDEERMVRFIRDARAHRNFALSATAPAFELLTHLNLLDEGRPTHAAVLLFGFQPQRFLVSSEVKCAHYHGTETAKPIPSLQIYKGTVFDLVDQAVDFVMSKLNLSVGTRASSIQAPSEYEI
ncbi:MAG TPA: transcriptional regulator, partial [Verrucomicrobiales bacterium]|nr:transcriptional regulator [Verrucomicrobiales bacterium]